MGCSYSCFLGLGFSALVVGFICCCWSWLRLLAVVLSFVVLFIVALEFCLLLGSQLLYC